MSPSRRRLVALLVFPVLLATACGTYQPVEESALAPDVLSTKIFAADGTLITTLRQEENRELVPIDKIPKHARDAVVAIEDARFYSHKGFDAKAILRALYRNATEGVILEGGSTITQQLVRNSIEDVGTEQTLDRKVREAAYAYRVDSSYSKDKILELYLNTVYFGQGAYGIQTAAQTFFAKNAEDLDLPEAALLAGLIKAPVNYDPYTDADVAVARRNLVLDRMFVLRFADAESVAAAKSAPLRVQKKVEQDRYPAPYFVDHVTRLIQHSDEFADLGESTADRANILFRGGLRIHTTLDLRMQRAAEESIARVLNRPDDPAASLVAISPKDGHVKALVGGRDFFAPPERDPCVLVGAINADGTPKTCAKVNLALGADGGGTGRQAGSSFKPFVLATALEQGIPLSTTYRAPSCLSIPNADAGGTAPWRVCNYGGAGYGRMDLVAATARSVNTVYAQLMMDVGPENVIETAEKMGIQSPLEAVPSAVLGVNPISALDMARAFTVFPNSGMYIEPIAITEITDVHGNVVWRPDQERTRAISEGSAYLATTAMEETLVSGTGSRQRLGRPAFAKTGTSEDWWDAWFIGGAGTDLVTAVGVFWPDFEIPMVPSCAGERTRYEIRGGVVVPPTCRPTRLRVTGGVFPGQIWQNFMLTALQGIPASELPEVETAVVRVAVDITRGCLPNPYTPSGVIRTRVFVSGSEPTQICREPTGPPEATIPDVTGFPESEAVRLLENAGFEVQRLTEESNLYPPGRVVRQEPDAGVEVSVGTTVTIWVSETLKKKIPNVVGMSDVEAISALENEGYAVLVDREEGCPKGSESCRVSAQDPTGGARAPEGTEVTIFVTKND